MTTEIDDGGPAFPCKLTMTHRGASLRDYFAAAAMQGIVSSIDSEPNYQRLRGHAAALGLSVSQWIARDAYKQADAMIAAREGGAK